MKNNVNRIKNTDEFMEKLNSVRSDQFSYISGEYKNRDSIMTLKCNKCGYDSPRVARLFIKFDCPGCKGLAKLDTCSYKHKVSERVGEEYTVLGEYKNGTSKILMKHNICGNEWEVIAKNFLRSQRPTRCPKCSIDKISNNEFLEKFNSIPASENFNIKNNCDNGTATSMELFCKKCKRIHTRTANSILNSNYMTCKFCHNPNLSAGVQIIIDFLERNNIAYDLEVYFENFKSSNGNRFKYDILLVEQNLLIEFDGIQHFQESNHRFNKNVRFRDLLKNDKILLSKYSLLRISYSEINNIDEILQDIILDKSSTTIQKYNLFFIDYDSERNYNLNNYYTSRSTFKRMETGDTSYYNLWSEDIVSTSSEN